MSSMSLRHADKFQVRAEEFWCLSDLRRHYSEEQIGFP